MGHFCDVWIGWMDWGRWKGSKGHNKALRVTELLRQTPNKRAEGREINSDSCYAQAASGIFDREDETRKEGREYKKEEMRRRRERWGTFWRPTLLPIVIRQLPIASPPLHNSDVLPPRDLRLLDHIVLFPIYCRTSEGNNLFQCDHHFAFNHVLIVRVS